MRCRHDLVGEQPRAVPRRVDERLAGPLLGIDCDVAATAQLNPQRARQRRLRRGPLMAEQVLDRQFPPIFQP